MDFGDGAPDDLDGLARALDDAGRRLLLDVARDAVRAAVLGAPSDVATRQGAPRTPVYGAFVTLDGPGGELRGCIGRLGRPGPAATLVAESAASSAAEDPRFDPVRPDELDGLRLTISLLTPLVWFDPADLPDAVEVGRHGLVVEQPPWRGLLLPQVATELGWDKVRFLEETCRKAGLQRDAWRQGARVAHFSALVF